jgi:hypothetical protein
MKLFIDLREDEAGAQPRCQLAITLPGKWLQFPVVKLLDTYVQHYNKKFAAESHISASEWTVTVRDPSPFARSPWKVLDVNALMCDSFSDRHEIWLARMTSADGAGKPSGGLTCKNYGCQNSFTDATNSDEACCHHTGAPIFHDTRKWWSCCEQHKVYDFDGLFAIQGCARGRHSERLPEPGLKANAILRAQSAKAAERVQFIRQPALPAQDTSVVPGLVGSSPAPSLALEPPKPKLNLAPGMARCKHFGMGARSDDCASAKHAARCIRARPRTRRRGGRARRSVLSPSSHLAYCLPCLPPPLLAGCQKDFEIATNGVDACRYHAESPVFHDGTKKWPCCKKSAWEFDDFISIPGCATGPHESVECL